jgi:hypothetical protein
MSRTRRRRPGAWVLFVVGAFASGILVSWMLWSWLLGGNGAGDGTDGVAGEGAVESGESFAISGDLTEPVSPGIAVALDVSIANDHDRALLVSDLIVAVQSIDAPNATESLPCDTEDFVVEQISAGSTLSVDPRTTSSLSELGVAPADWPQVGMVDAPTNQDGCKGASLGLAYTATGRFDR